MNLIEALKAADGKPVRRKAWLYSFNKIRCGTAWLVEDSSNDGISPKADACLDNDNLLADDWYVVDPKSRIEEAIEREAKGYWQGRGCNDPTITELCKHMRRAVNLALEEAVKASVDFSIKQGVEQRIRALKVKE